MCYKSAQKGHLLFKRENLNFTIEFSVFESLKVWNFILNRQFWFFGSTFPKRVFPIQIKRTDRCDNIQRMIFVLGTNLDSSSQKDSSSQRSKFKHHDRIQHIRITFNTNFPSWTNNFVFLDSICPKRLFPI